MRRLLSTFLILFSLCSVLRAQDIAVASFELDENDLTANSYGTIVMDQNRDKCALIKVETTQMGFTFDVGRLGVVKTEQHTAEIWVYVPAGVRRISIAHQQLGRLNDYDLGMTLQKAKTYRLKLISGSVVSTVVETKVKTGWIILSSQPSGAAVYINEQWVGNTPLDNYKAEYGQYTYRIESEYYHNASGIINLDKPRYEEDIILKPAFGSVTINCPVYGAQVLLDGKNTGHQTPCKLEKVPSGEHNVTIQMARYSTYQQSVTVKDGEDSKIEATLDPRFAEVTIMSIPDTKIVIDGQQVGIGSFKGDLNEGYHDIEISKNHYKKLEKQIKVEAGVPQSLNLKPTPIVGSLDVTSKPHNASIHIDGVAYGKTPNSIDSLLEGSHQIALTLDGYNTERFEVNIEDSKTVSVEKTLTKKTSQERINKTSQNTTIGSSQKTTTPIRYSINDSELHKFYIGGGYQAYPYSAVTACIGGNIGKINLEASAAIGIVESPIIYFNYIDSNYDFDIPNSYTYKPMMFMAKVGYAFPFVDNRLIITPQVGIGLCIINGTEVDKVGGYGVSNFSAIPMHASIRLDWRILKNFGISCVPSYAKSINDSEAFSNLSKVTSDIESYANGFCVNAGINFYF